MINNLLEKLSAHGNWVDLIFILLLIYFILTNKGFLDTLLDLIGFVFSLFFSYKFYSFFGQLLVANFSLPKGLSYAAGFFIAWFVAEVILYSLLSLFFRRFFRSIEQYPLNRILGYVAAVAQTVLIFLFLVSLIFSLPVRGQIKEDILQSRTGPYFVNLSSQFEKNINTIFGDAVSETLNFLTVKPESNETVNLGFKVVKQKLKIDVESEKIMFNLINVERGQRRIKQLVFDNNLRDLGRSYGQVMFENGFFSHTSLVDGSTPADRANSFSISYYVIGENLAFAPDVYLAQQGLMNSPGHRANILSTEYRKVGIGVIDGGIYGRIFVQEFTN